jgi:ATP-binding cassette subfamily B protein
MTPADLIDPFRPAAGAPPRRLLPFVGWCLSGAWPALWVAAAISSLSGVMEVMAALVLGAVIDATVNGVRAGFFDTEAWLLVWAAVFFVLLRPISFGLAAASNAIVVMPNVQPLVLSRLHRWTLGQAVTFFDNDFAGRIAQKQMQTANALTDVTSEMINTVAFALASVLGSALLLLAINGWVSGALMLWIVAYLGFIALLLPKVRTRAAARAGARAAVSGQIVDTITNIKTVKLFAHARHEDGAALGAMRNFRARAIEFGVISAWFRLALMTIAGTLPVILVGGTLWFWAEGQATAGDIAAAATIGIRIAQMSGWVSFTLMTIYANLGEIEDGMRTLTPPHGLVDAPDATELPPARGEIRFDGVAFAYGRRSGGVAGIDLTIAAGEKIGIVGASGAGKSTLVALLLRLYDAEAGRVLVDGRDLRGVTQESLRRQIGMVTQETAMFNRSALDNIRYGRPDASRDQVEAAARAAEAHDFILSLRDHAGRGGYDAHLGERGVKLSGGQRQRIALARAFLKDAPILVLDEATSALDSEVEAAVQSALNRLMQDKTVLAIAHRLSTIAAMDRIVVMDQGRIAEIGTHAALLARQGLYARYWTRQSGGFIGVDRTEAAE